MDFRLGESQLALQDAMRSYCTANQTVDRLGEREGQPLRTVGWTALAEMDALRVCAPEATGGLDLGVVDAAVVFEVLGEHLVAGPLVWTALAARFFGDLVPGDAVIGGLDLRGRSDHAVLVEHAQDLDALMVLRDDGVFVVAPGEIASIQPVEPTDPLTPVSFAERIPAGRRVGDAATMAAMVVVGETLSAALLVGIAETGVQSGVAYAKQREQFGKPIGSFQAIKHLLADSYVRASLARSATLAAAAIIDDPEVGDAPRAAAAAKLLAADAAIRNARTCIQVHGGMGFTWEMVPHYLLKRAWVLESSFGTRTQHREHLAAALEAEIEATS